MTETGLIKCPRCHSSQTRVTKKRGVTCYYCGYREKEAPPKLICPECGYSARFSKKRGTVCYRCGYREQEELPRTLCPNCGKSARISKRSGLTCYHCGYKERVHNPARLRCPSCGKYQTYINRDGYIVCYTCKKRNPTELLQEQIDRAVALGLRNPDRTKKVLTDPC